MHHRAATALAVLCAAAALAGCAPDWSTPRAAPTAVGTPAPGFVPAVAPSPEATVEPPHGSWRTVSPPRGYRVVLLTGGDDATTAALAQAVREWADEYEVDLRTVSEPDPVTGIAHAMDLHPELIVAAGDPLIDALAMVTPNHLDVPFLILGAEIAEPTYNVTAVEWTGAGFRGEGLGTATHFDAASFTPQRCGDAIRAGAAAVLTGLTGVVLWIA